MQGDSSTLEYCQASCQEGGHHYALFADGAQPACRCAAECNNTTRSTGWDVYKNFVCQLELPYGEQSTTTTLIEAAVADPARYGRSARCGNAECQAEIASFIRNTPHTRVVHYWVDVNRLPPTAPEDIVSCFCEEDVYDVVLSNGIGWLSSFNKTLAVCASAKSARRD